MSGNFTPGPWHVEAVGGDISIHRADELGESIAEMYTIARDGDQISNAHLIAASPELLEAAERLIEHYAHCLPDHMANEIRAVIAKAKGQS